MVIITTVTTENLFYDLSAAITNAGEGDYFFIVQSETGSTGMAVGDPDNPSTLYNVNWSGSLSEKKQSVTIYRTSLGAPSDANWQDGSSIGTAATWRTIEGVQAYELELYRNGTLVYAPTLGSQSAAGGEIASYGVSGYVYNYGGEFQFRVRPIQQDIFVGDWAESEAKTVDLEPVSTINIENASLDVTAGQVPHFTATVARDDEQYY